jgi:hypothetical protein
MKSVGVTLAFATLGCLLMGGCVTKTNPAHTEVYYPGVGTVDYHCPPGHRKKGEC